MSCETDLSSIKTNTSNTNTSVKALESKIEDMKTKQDKTNELLTKIVIAFNGSV